MENTRERAMTQTKETAREPRVYSPATDILETADGLTVKMEMPGVPKDGIDISVEKSTITVQGHVKAPEGLAEFEPVHREFDADAYRRSYTFSNEFDLEKIDASHADGVLTLRIPRSESAKPRRIEIR